MKKPFQIKLKLEIPGKTLESLTWPEFRDFMDSFSRALKAMNPDADVVGSMLPVSLQEGSISAAIQTSPAVKGSVSKLRKGPTRNWTNQMHNETRSFYQYLSDHNADLFSIDAKKKVKFVIPELAPALETISGPTEQIVYIERIGGIEPRVTVRFFDGSKISCRTHDDVLKGLGAYIWDYVKVRGTAKWSVGTYELQDFVIDEIDRDWKNLPFSEIMAKNDNRFPVDLSGFSVTALISQRKEERNEAN